MKRSVFVLTTAFLVNMTLFLSAQSPLDKIYEKYSGQDGFTAVNFSKEMFQMIQQMSLGDSVKAELKETKQIVDQLSGLKVLMYSFDSAGVSKAISIYNELAGAFSSSAYKELMTVQEGRQYVKFLTKSAANNKVSEFVMLMKDREEVGVISISGLIDLSSVSDISKFMNIKGMENLKKIQEEKMKK